MAVPSLFEFYPGICLTTEEKHGKTSVRVAEEIQSIHIIRKSTRYKTHTYTHTLQNPHIHTHITKPTHAHTHITKPTHTHTHTHTHTLQNNLKPPQYQLKQTQYKIYPNEIDSQYNQFPSV
jgi:hypothetical protein